MMYNASDSIKNATTTTTNVNSSETAYWEYIAIDQQLNLQLDVPDLAPSIQALQHQPAAFAPSDNKTTQHAQAEPPPPFYTSFNISDDLFDYFNGFLETTEPQQQQQIFSTSTELTSTHFYNVTVAAAAATSTTTETATTTVEQYLFDHFQNLPNDQAGLLAFLILFSFATVFGNSLVIIAVIRERYLHTATNYFITSLAVADCLVGLVVMPFSALYEVLDNTWFFGTDWCDIWRSLDVLFSTASILNLCVISLDRYWAITDPFSYPMRMTVKRAALLICGVWVCSSAISFPAIVWWRAARDGEMPAYKCTFTEHLGYLVFSSTISFYLPLLVMVFTYCRIYRAAVIQTRSLKIGTKQVLMASGELQLTLRIHRGGTTREPSTSSHQHPMHGSLGGGGGGISGGSQHHSHHHHHHHNHSASGTTTSTPEEPDDEPLSALHNNGLARHRHMGKNFSLSRKLAKFAKEKKAAKTLGIVMGVFIICWLPFFVVNLLSGFCMSCIAHEEIVSAIVTWLGWINSCMNPVIYACWSRDFRRAFLRILCVCCPRKLRRKYQPTMRSKSQCHVAGAAIVAASTSFGYSSVNRFDGNRSIMCRQHSTCSSCSGSSSYGRGSLRHSHRHHYHNHHHYPQQLQQQHEQQLQRERSCTRCQSFHRHHHRQRRRSSSVHHMLRNEYGNAEDSVTTKAIVTILPAPAPPSSTASSRLSTTAPTGSTLTISSVPATLLLSPGATKTAIGMGSVSAVTTPSVAPPVASAIKHCSFALTPIAIPSPTSPSTHFSPIIQTSTSLTSSAVTASAPSLIEPANIVLRHGGYQSTEQNAKARDRTQHPMLEMRQSVQSQMTTVEDMDEDFVLDEPLSSSSSSSIPRDKMTQQ